MIELPYIYHDECHSTSTSLNQLLYNPRYKIVKMVLKIYGHANSTCTRTVEAVLKEKNVPFELVTINFMKGEHKQAEYMEKHPFGLIPYIVSLRSHDTAIRLTTMRFTTG
jgi:hypothetical protein